MMEKFRSIFQGSNGILLSSLLFLVAIVVTYFIYKIVLNKLQKKALTTIKKTDDFIIDLLRIPVLWLLFFTVFNIFSTYSFLSKTTIYPTLTKINSLLLIVTMGWILAKIVRVVFYHYETKLDLSTPDNYSARGNLTKLKIFERAIVALIIIATVAICLMSFDKVRTLGISLLTSAGIAGIIVGFAAQKSLASVAAGIQIAITQPILLDDLVIIDGQQGIIEEINFTYVVMRLSDEKRLIVPANFFLEKSFQNLTRNSSNIIGSIFLFVDYKMPVDELRKQLTVILKDNPNWDKRVANVQIADVKEDCMKIRIQLSSGNSSANSSLQVQVREEMIKFINENYSDYFVKPRIVREVESKAT